MSSTIKSRNLSVFELFEILQQEYIVCELRTKINPIQVHKQYWQDIAEKKKQKIDNIANRNKIPSIFTSTSVREYYEKQIIRDIGYPNFIYRDESQRARQEEWDLKHYYHIGKEVKYIVKKQMKIGKLVDRNFELKKVWIEIQGIVEEISMETVTRIL